VLILRPETEILVDLVQEVEGFQDGVWVDQGTGSGALAVAIGKLMDGVLGEFWGQMLALWQLRWHGLMS
jgi:hypothetical protein